ncbi:MAG: hypothetical protein QNJ62_06260 [Methyloceanibacter sp.]|nr:hypothetical protein [Methyloceanibacter sp.]
MKKYCYVLPGQGRNGAVRANHPYDAAQRAFRDEYPIRAEAVGKKLTVYDFEEYKVEQFQAINEVDGSIIVERIDGR